MKKLQFNKYPDKNITATFFFLVINRHSYSWNGISSLYKKGGKYYNRNFIYTYRVAVFNLCNKKYITYYNVISSENSEKKNEYAWHGQKSKTNNGKGDDTRRNATTNKKDVHSSSAISRDAQDASRNIHVVR